MKRQATAAKQAAASARSSRPLFGTNQANAAAKKPTYRRPAPLITSGDAARHAVRRAVAPGYGYGWGW